MRTKYMEIRRKIELLKGAAERSVNHEFAAMWRKKALRLEIALMNMSVDQASRKV